MNTNGSEPMPKLGSEVVFKYPLMSASTVAPLSYTEIDCQSGAKFIEINVQEQKFMAWAVVDPSAPLVTRKIWIVGTGTPIPVDAVEYIDTIHTVHQRNPRIAIHGGSQQTEVEYVWHIFAGKEVSQ